MTNFHIRRTSMEINEEIFRERGQELELYDEDDYEQLEEERIKEEE